VADWSGCRTGYFEFFIIRGDIRKSICTNGINDTGGKFDTGTAGGVDTGSKIYTWAAARDNWNRSRLLFASRAHGSSYQFCHCYGFDHNFFLENEPKMLLFL
jgi:hypothetical protein